MDSKLIFLTTNSASCKFCSTLTKFTGAYSSLYEAICASYDIPNFTISVCRFGRSFSTSIPILSCFRAKIIQKDVKIERIVGDNETARGSLSYVVLLDNNSGLYMASPYCRQSSQYKLVQDNIVYYL